LSAAPSSPVDDLVAGLRGGDRRALAQAITLVESTHPDHRVQAEDLLAQLLPATGGALRLGITGVPGVGKSTFIEAFGAHLIDAGRRVAVLAVDPSSQVNRGSILGDKTRMAELARNPAAFIRPSPAGQTLGGVARRTREAMLVCEAAGFDVVIVETVGVGQSETAVAEMADVFVLLLQPGGGDELQGFKRGIMELADLFVITKADGELEAAAARAAAEYQGALGLLRPGRGDGTASPDWRPPVLQCSAVTGSGIPEVWAAVGRCRENLSKGLGLAARRGAQAEAWMWRELGEALTASLRAHPAVAARLVEIEVRVRAGTLTPAAAARDLLDAYRR